MVKRERAFLPRSPQPTLPARRGDLRGRQLSGVPAVGSLAQARQPLSHGAFHSASPAQQTTQRAQNLLSQQKSLQRGTCGLRAPRKPGSVRKQRHWLLALERVTSVHRQGGACRTILENLPHTRNISAARWNLPALAHGVHEGRPPPETGTRPPSGTGRGHIQASGPRAAVFVCSSGSPLPWGLGTPGNSGGTVVSRSGEKPGSHSVWVTHPVATGRCHPGCIWGKGRGECPGQRGPDPPPRSRRSTPTNQSLSGQQGPGIHSPGPQQKPHS